MPLVARHADALLVMNTRLDLVNNIDGIVVISWNRPAGNSEVARRGHVNPIDVLALLQTLEHGFHACGAIAERVGETIVCQRSKAAHEGIAAKPLGQDRTIGVVLVVLMNGALAKPACQGGVVVRRALTTDDDKFCIGARKAIAKMKKIADDILS